MVGSYPVEVDAASSILVGIARGHWCNGNTEASHASVESSILSWPTVRSLMVGNPDFQSGLRGFNSRTHHA